MKRIPNQIISFLSFGVVIAVLLCQVLGSTCPGISDAHEGEATTLNIHAPHMMPGGMSCLEGLPESSGHVSKLPLFFVIEPVHRFALRESLLVHGHSVSPGETGPPRYTALSTFRI